MITDEIVDEVARQNTRYGTFGGSMPVGRLRLGIAVLDDEVKEVLDAWTRDRKTNNWWHTREETIQVIAVGIRLLMQIDTEMTEV